MPAIREPQLSRLDSFIERLQVQRSVLDWAAEKIAGRDGIVLELGLGNGRTYDHLRERLPTRKIFAFDRQLAANPRSMPASDALILGELEDTLPEFARRHGSCAILVHVDLKIGVPELEKDAPPWLVKNLAALVRPGGIVLCDYELVVPLLSPMPLPASIGGNRYFAYETIAAIEPSCPSTPRGV